MPAIEQYRLPAAQGLSTLHQGMAALGKRAAHRFIYARFDIDFAQMRENPREIERSLHILAIDITVEHYRHMAHRLVGPAHHPERQVDFSLGANHRRDDRM